MTETDDPRLLRYAAGIDRQVGALAWMPEDADLRFWIVTSRRTGRWVLPKGSVDPGMTPSEAAAQEAFEEVGLTGEIDHAPIGGYRIPKIRPPLIWTVDVEIYALRVTHVAETWLEQDERQRRLVTLTEAHQLIEDEEILRTLRASIRKLPVPGTVS
ncbi:MAG: NUDIX domain-containing protein [Pseudomonadota bacterium]